MTTFTNWAYQLYVYIISIITLVIAIIAAIMLLHLVVKTFVFGLEGSYYRSPIADCAYERFDPTVKDAERSIYGNKEECIAARTEEIAMSNAYDRTSTISQALAMLLISTPIYLYHWRIIRTSKK